MAAGEQDMLEQLLATPGTAAEDDHAWRDAAACQTEDPELFFPEGESERYRLQIAAALSVCAGCAVVESCLSYALETEQHAGIWGGTTPTQRRALEVAGDGAGLVGRRRLPAAAALAGPIVASVVDEPDADLHRAAG
jgi:WhiB family transcriptional regulator, redox-sensing transcriptional regulator